MSKLGTFNDQSVSLFKEHFEQPTAFSEATEVYDFARCQRPDGSVYGTSGQCRKGTDAGAKQKRETKPRKTPVAAKEKAMKDLMDQISKTPREADRKPMIEAYQKLEREVAKSKANGKGAKGGETKSTNAPTTRQEAQALRRAAVVNALKKEGLPTSPPSYKSAMNKALKAHPEYEGIRAKTKELQRDADAKRNVLKEVRKRQEKNPHDLAIRQEARGKEQAWQQAQRDADKSASAMRTIERQEQRKLDDRLRSVTSRATSEARKREPIVGNDMGSPKRLGDADILTSPYD